jgi:pimeloyl-ACP methyl ester carboxylesterase
LSVLYDYRNNLKLYPQWQQYLRDYQPPVLVVWGRNDAFFPVSGAEGYRRDVEDIDYNLLDTGHFALEEIYKVITAKIRQFLQARHI